MAFKIHMKKYHYLASLKFSGIFLALTACTVQRMMRIILYTWVIRIMRPGSSKVWGSLGFDIYVKSPSRIVNLGHQNFVGNVVVLIYDDCKIVFVPYKRMMMTRKLIIWYYMCVQIENRILEKSKYFKNNNFLDPWKYICSL